MSRVEYFIPDDGTNINGVTADTRSFIKKTKRNIAVSGLSMSLGVAGITSIFATEQNTQSTGLGIVFLASLGAAFLGTGYLKKGIEEYKELNNSPYMTGYSPRELKRMMTPNVDLSGGITFSYPEKMKPQTWKLIFKKSSKILKA